jgi:hypothetical protein
MQLSGCLRYLIAQRPGRHNCFDTADRLVIRNMRCGNQGMVEHSDLVVAEIDDPRVVLRKDKGSQQHVEGFERAVLPRAW